MAASKVKLTEKQVSDALETFAEWFPEEAASIKKHRDAITRYIIEGLKFFKYMGVLQLH